MSTLPGPRQGPVIHRPDLRVERQNTAARGWHDATRAERGGFEMTRALNGLGLATMLAGALLLAPPASASFVSLPASGALVNDDPPNSIDPNQDVGLVDVAGGTVVAGNIQVPWATFEQKVGRWQQIFVRAFKNGAWVTEGFPASLNIDPTAKAEAPSIDFAGAGRATPWVAWYEPS